MFYVPSPGTVFASHGVENGVLLLLLLFLFFCFCCFVFWRLREAERMHSFHLCGVYVFFLC